MRLPSFQLKGIRGRLFMLLALPIAVLVGTVTVSYQAVQLLSSKMAVLSIERLPVTQQVGELRFQMNATIAYALKAYTADDQKKRGEAVSAMQNEINKFNTTLKSLRTAETTPEVLNEMKAIDPAWQETSAHLLDIMLALGERTKEADMRALFMINENLVASDKQLNGILDKVDQAANSRTSDIVIEGATHARNINRTIVGIAVGSSFLVLIVAFWMISRIANSLRMTTSAIGQAGERFGGKSVELARASGELSSGAQAAAASIEETVASIEELSSMVKLNADNAVEASRLSAKSHDSATEGQKQMSKLVEAVNDIAQGSKKIEEIISVIDDIAFQTNLLALNAAVEAARAGEQGKGFAVVAEAVRNLAQRASSSAKDITGLIKESVHKAESGAQIANLSGKALNEILDEVRKVSQLNAEISAGSQEQSQGLQQINRAMTQLDESIQSNAAAAELVARASADIEDEAKTLEVSVNELQVSIDGAVLRSSPVEQSSAPVGSVLPFESKKAARPNVAKARGKKTAY